MRNKDKRLKRKNPHDDLQLVGWVERIANPSKHIKFNVGLRYFATLNKLAQPTRFYERHPTSIFC